MRCGSTVGFWRSKMIRPIKLHLFNPVAQRRDMAQRNPWLHCHINATCHNVRFLFQHPTGYRREVWKLHRFVSDFWGDSEVENWCDVCGFNLAGSDICLSREAVCMDLHTGNVSSRESVAQWKS